MNLPERVLPLVLSEVDLPDHLIEFLFLLLEREMTDGKYNWKSATYSDWEVPNFPSEGHVEHYALMLLQLLKPAKPFIHGTDGFKTTFLSLYKAKTGYEEFKYVPNEFAYWASGGYLIRDLGEMTTNFLFPQNMRRRHTHIVGSTGTGKTQLMQQMISYDLDTNASIIVIDSQGDLINKLRSTKLIDDERLVIVDPVDSVTYPLALNMFDVKDRDNPVEQERHINGVIELLNFVFSAVMDSALTDKQSVMFNFCNRLLLSIPGATLQTFIDILENGTDKYQRYVNTLPEVARKFFNHSFVQKSYGHTKEEILRRLYFLMENPTISRLFQSPENRLDISEEMDAGKVILISTDRSLLKREGCAFFGRYFLSLIAQAMQDRANRPEHHRRKCYVYVDECGDYLNSSDVNITDILEKGRKYNVSITLAHQHDGQLPPDVLQSVRQNTAIKMRGAGKPLTFSVELSGFAAFFLIYATYGTIEDSEQRSTEELEVVMHRNRLGYCVSQNQPELRMVADSQAEYDETKDVPGDDIEDWNVL